MQMVRLRSKVGPAEFTTWWGPKKVVFSFNKENDYTCEVPTKVTYKDSFGDEKNGPSNYAQHLLDSYDYLELVDVVEQPAVVPKKKGKKHEAVSE